MNDLDNFNRIMINMIHNQINSIVEERRGLERNKNWRKIPTEVKEKYYEGYNVLINALYDTLDDLEKGSSVSFEEYREVTDLGMALAEYVIEVLKAYGIDYKVI